MNAPDGKRRTRPYRIEVDYTVETRGPLHVGCGHGAGPIDRAMLRDANGLPFIPGSTIKGRTRLAAVRICRWMGLSVLEEPAGEERGERSPNGPAGIRDRDLPTRIFGCAWQRCTLRFGDARAELPSNSDAVAADEAARRGLRERAHGLREVRTSAGRARLLSITAHGSLYQTELAPPGLRLHGQVRGVLACTAPLVGSHPHEPLLLWLALRLMVQDGVGGNKSSGSGALALLEAESIAMKLDGAPFAPSEEEAAEVMEYLLLIEEQRAGA